MHRLTLVIWLVLLLAASGRPANADLHADHTEHAARAQAIEVEERLGAKVPLDVTFRDETGRTVTLASLVTGPTLILPVYYGCTNVCNYLQGGLARTLPQVNLVPVEEYRVLSLSFDETETPDLAARYQKTYLTSMNAPFPAEGWHFLTGERDAILRFTDAIGYRFRREGRDFVHPLASVVVTGDGTIVRYFYGTHFLSKDVTLALIEAREGRIGNVAKRLVEYCFSYDPQQRTYVFNLLRVSATVVLTMLGAFFLYLVLSGRKGRRPPEPSHHE